MRHIEFAWKEKTNVANLLFQLHNFEEASRVYKEALYRAEVLSSYKTLAEKLSIPFVQVFTTSCTNLALAHEKLCEIDEGKKMLERVVLYLLCLLAQRCSHKSSIESQLKIALLNYSDFAQKHHLHVAEEKAVFLRLQKRQAALYF